MTPGTRRTSDHDRHDLQRELQQSVEEARAALTRAVGPAERAAAAEQLRVAVQKLMDFTWNENQPS